MSLAIGPTLNRNGLVLSLDFQNRKSALPNTSLIDMSAWAAGQTSSVGVYGANESTSAENARVSDTDPFGRTSVVWETRTTGDNNADGGWNTSYMTADKTKLYRFSVWVRRTSSSSGGTFYFGLYTNGTGNTYLVDTGASQTNPYWEYRGTGSLIQNQWYLVVGHLFPYNYASTAIHPDSGWYTRSGGMTKVSNNAGNVPNDVRFPSDATSVVHRTYHYYSGDPTVRLQFFDPRIDLCDGNQPSIGELLAKSPTVWHDTSGFNNHCVWASGAKPAVTTAGYYDFNGTSHYGTITNNSTLDFSTEQTLIMWLYTTSSSGRRNPWNQAYAGYGTWTDEPGGSMSHYMGDGGADTSPYTSLGTTFNRNQWYMIATTRNTSVWRNYSNGLPVTSETSHTYGVLTSTAANILVGYGYTGGYFQGRMGAIYAYNRYLSAAEMYQAYNALRGRYGI